MGSGHALVERLWVGDDNHLPLASRLIASSLKGRLGGVCYQRRQHFCALHSHGLVHALASAVGGWEEIHAFVARQTPEVGVHILCLIGIIQYDDPYPCLSPHHLIQHNTLRRGMQITKQKMLFALFA